MHPDAPKLLPENTKFATVELSEVDFGGSVTAPGSKSLTNRALLVAGFADGESKLGGVLECDDSLYMIDALRELGVGVAVERPDGFGGNLVVSVSGTGEFPVKKGRFFLGNAGTATRFLTAALAGASGEYVIDGDARMRERPIGDLVETLRQLGAKVEAPTGCPPVTIWSGRLGGGDIGMPGKVSSQFISAVMMASVASGKKTKIKVMDDLVSRPYLDLTIDVMRAFGAKVFVYDKTVDGMPIFEMAASSYTGREYNVEGDASAASYFFAAAAVTGATIRVEGVGRESRQGDIRCADVLAQMGCRVIKESAAIQVTGDILNSVDCDCSDMPDVVPTLAVVAMFARGKTRLRGVPHLRDKESDRIASVASEIRKLGGRVNELDDGLEVYGSPDQSGLHGAQIQTWKDHRIAMAFSVAGLVIPGVVINEPGVISKSYPGFFHAMASIGADVKIRLNDGREEIIEPLEGDA